MHMTIKGIRKRYRFYQNKKVRGLTLERAPPSLTPVQGASVVKCQMQTFFKDLIIKCPLPTGYMRHY